MTGSEPKTVGKRQALSWSASSWFGGQIGGTCWMLLAAMVLMGSSVGLGLTLVALFIAVNGIGWLLWRQRESISVHAGSFRLVVGVSLANVAALVAIHQTGHWSKVEIGGSIPPAVALTGVIGVACAALILIARRGRREAGSD